MKLRRSFVKLLLALILGIPLLGWAPHSVQAAETEWTGTVTTTVVVQKEGRRYYSHDYVDYTVREESTETVTYNPGGTITLSGRYYSHKTDNYSWGCSGSSTLLAEPNTVIPGQAKVSIDEYGTARVEMPGYHFTVNRLWEDRCAEEISNGVTEETIWFGYPRVIAPLEGVSPDATTLSGTVPGAQSESWSSNTDHEFPDYDYESGSRIETRTYDLTRAAPGNQEPNADAGGPYTVAEGSSITLEASGSDAEGDALVYRWDLDDDGNFETWSSTATFSAAGRDGNEDSENQPDYVVAQVCDGAAGCDTDTATVIITNAAPTVNPLNVVTKKVKGKTLVTVNATFSDPGTADTHTATWNWGDSSPSEQGTMSGASGSGSVTGSHTYPDGTYTITLTVTDKDGAQTQRTHVLTLGPVKGGGKK